MPGATPRSRPAALPESVAVGGKNVRGTDASYRGRGGDILGR